MDAFLNKFITLIILINFTLIPNLFSQDNYYKSKYELGFGLSLLGTGDITSVSIMNEIDHRVGKMLELSMAIGFGKGIPRYNFLPVFALSTFHINANAYFIPFQIKNIYKLKLGGGYSLFNLNEVGTQSGHIDENNVYIVDKYSINNYTTNGYNVLIENELLIYKNISAAFLLFFQRYQNHDTNAGGMLKIGYNF